MALYQGMNATGHYALYMYWYLQRKKNIQVTPMHKKGSWYLLEALFKVSEADSGPFYIGVPPSPGFKVDRYTLGDMLWGQHRTHDAETVLKLDILQRGQTRSTSAI